MFFLFMYGKVGESQEIWGKRINEEHAGRPAEDLLLRALALMFYALIHWVTLRLVIVLSFLIQFSLVNINSVSPATLPKINRLLYT